MARIAMLLPHQDMIENAVYASNFYHLELSFLCVLKRGTSKKDAQAAIDSGADIIVARGGQATSIAEYVNIPIVEIKLTSHEIGIMLKRARQMTDKPEPKIALIGPENMFVSLDAPMFNNQYHVRFAPYLFTNPDEMLLLAAQAMDEGADVIIGGPDVFSYCQRKGIPCLRTVSGRESIMEACRIAQIVGNALEQEKSYSASLNLLLNHTFSGIIQIDTSGKILRTNSFVEHLVMLDLHQMTGIPVWNFIPGISEKIINTVMTKKKEIHSISIQYGLSEFIVSISPILVGQTVSGAIISFHEGLRLEQQEEKERIRLAKINQASTTFDSFIARSPITQQVIQRAKRYALYSTPILLIGTAGSGRHLLAECIHNNSAYKKLPFLYVRCGGYNAEDIEEILAKYLGYERSENPSSSNNNSEKPKKIYQGPCTLYLHEVSDLSLRAQQHLFSYLQRQILIQKISSGMPQGNTRIIASTSIDIRKAVAQGSFLPELYYALSAMTLQIPPLCKRKEDIMGWVDFYTKDMQEQYSRYVKFTKDAREFLVSYPWNGNLPELYNLCNRILLNCTHYYVSAADIEQELNEVSLSPENTSDNHIPAHSLPSVTQFSDRRSKIIHALHQHDGRREDAAKDLGVSVSTLWRWMKQYRIPKDEGKYHG